MSNDKKYLQKRGHTWHCRVRVPPSLQDRLGKSHILKSLKTRDLAEARRRRWPVVANIKAELQRLAKGKPTPREDQFRQLLEDYRAQALGGDDVDRDVAFDFLMEYASRLLKADISPDGPGLDDNLKAQLDYGAGGRSVLLSLVLDEYLRAHEGHLKHATLADRQRAVRSITEHLGGDPDVSGLTRRQIGDWLHAMAAEGRAANTVKATLSHLSSVLAWAMDRGYLEQNPADRAGRSIKARKTAKRVPWTTEELSAMFGPEGLQDAGKAPLRSVAAILLFSGMRIEELCQVRLTDIDHEAKTINVQGGKTANARRVVPVHSAIWPVVERLAKASTDGYLITGQSPYGADLKRSKYVVKRFGAKVDALLPDRTATLHSFRHNAATALERAGVPLPTVQLLLGHSRQGVTLGTYSHGLELEQLRAAIDLISYGGVDNLI